MLLSNVLKDLKEKQKLNFKKFNPDIKGIHCNSKKILKNFIFVAIKGSKNDGHKYINDAQEKGAIFFIIENYIFSCFLTASYPTIANPDTGTVLIQAGTVPLQNILNP